MAKICSQSPSIKQVLYRCLKYYLFFNGFFSFKTPSTLLFSYYFNLLIIGVIYLLIFFEGVGG
jgi:hypothetical protein